MDHCKYKIEANRTRSSRSHDAGLVTALSKARRLDPAKTRLPYHSHRPYIKNTEYNYSKVS